MPKGARIVGKFLSRVLLLGDWEFMAIQLEATALTGPLGKRATDNHNRCLPTQPDHP